jgi:hypothetical protein
LLRRYERPHDADDKAPRLFDTEYAERVEHMKHTWYTTLNVDYGHLLDVRALPRRFSFSALFFKYTR